MFESKILDVFIGLTFTYLLYSLMATTIREAIAGLLDQRARTLYRGIKTMFTNTREYGSLGEKYLDVFVSFYRKKINWIRSIFKYKPSNQIYDKFYDHPIIKNFGQNRFFTKPSYINPKNFSSILAETLKNSIADADGKKVYQDAAINANHVREFLALAGVKNDFEIPAGHYLNITVDEDFVQVINLFFSEANHKIEDFKIHLEDWFNNTMDRVSGWYKRNNQVWLLIIGLTLAFFFDVDTIELTNTLLKNNKAREQLSAMAQASLQKSSENITSTDQEIITQAYDNVKDEINEVNGLIGFGWNDYGKYDSTFVRNLAEMPPPQNRKIISFLSPLQKIRKQVYDNCAPLREIKYAMEDRIVNCRRLLDMAMMTPDIYLKYHDLIDMWDENLTPYSKKYVNMFLVKAYHEILENEGQTAFSILYVWNRLSFQKMLGFLITAIAVSLGGPFWFDLLGKFVKMRSAGNKVKTEK